MEVKPQVVICAAGVGHRLRPLTEHCPKALIKVGDKTILEYQLDNISTLGIREVIIIVGYQAEVVIKKIGSQYKQCQITYIHNPDFATTNNIYSLFLAKDEIKNGVIFLNGDIIFHLEALRNLLIDQRPDAIAAYFGNDIVEDAMKARFKNERLVEINKKLSGDDLAWAIGMYKLSQVTSQEYFKIAEDLFKIAENKNISFVAPLQIMAEKIHIASVPVTQYKCLEIDTFEDYDLALKSVKEVLA